MLILVICVELIKKIFYGQCNSVIGLCVCACVRMCVCAYACVAMCELCVCVCVLAHTHAFACIVLSMIYCMGEFSHPLSAVLNCFVHVLFRRAFCIQLTVSCMCTLLYWLQYCMVQCTVLLVQYIVGVFYTIHTVLAAVLSVYCPVQSVLAEVPSVYRM